jgi:PAS domain S-box-containing protein
MPSSIISMSGFGPVVHCRLGKESTNAFFNVGRHMIKKIQRTNTGHEGGFFSSSRAPVKTKPLVRKAKTITRRAQPREYLRTSEIRYRRLFESARDGILILDAATRKITDVNPFMVKLLGYPRGQFLGKELWEIGLLEDAKTSRLAFRELKQNGYIRYEDLPLETKDGKRREVEFVSNVYDEGGYQVIQCNIRDITARKQREEEFKQLMVREKEARAEAEEANHVKDEFLATVSHELRTPLTAILGWSTMLCNDTLDEAASARALEVIDRNAKTQAQLIEDILDLSRIINGKLQLQVRPVGLAEIVNATIECLRPTADVKAIQIQAHLDPDVGLVSGDPNRLQQVVANLLANAIKFTPEGGRVKVKLGRVNSDALINVTDTGAGISAEFLPYVFDRFRQADSASTRKYSGLGLGLEIVRKIVEMHGGTVLAESCGEGQGASFTVKIPLLVLPQIEKSQANKSKRTGQVHEKKAVLDYPREINGLRVLLVDDDASTLEMLTAVLNHGGAEVRNCTSAAPALELLQEWKPDILLSDIAMPDKNGYWLIAQVRKLEKARGGRIPAVALTAYARVEDRARILMAGFDMFVPKPVYLPELLATLAGLVKNTVSRSLNH